VKACAGKKTNNGEFIVVVKYEYHERKPIKRG
jgi:hypothetical protein